MARSVRQDVDRLHSKNTIRRIDIEIVKRIIFALHDHGKDKKTKIALKAHISYDKCLKYLEWLEVMDLTSRENKDGFEVITLTEKGLDLYAVYSQKSN